MIDSAAAGVRRVLSIDGGGIRGAYAAAFLAGLEDCTGRPVGEYFDLVVGTSTGGIIALGLGLGLPAAALQSFYELRGPEIFPHDPFRSGSGVLRHLFASKYSAAPLRRALEEVFGSRRLADADRRLVVVSYDGNKGDIHLLKTQHVDRFRRDSGRLAVDIAMATSAAPTYFPANDAGASCEIDGGVWANCPALVAAIEATAVLGWSVPGTRLLSVGTTRPPFHVKPAWRRGGILQWLTGAGFSQLIMEGQTAGALAQARLLLGKEQVLRIDEVVSPGRFSLDRASGIADLVGLGRSSARHRFEEVRDAFLWGPADPFRPSGIRVADQPTA